MERISKYAEMWVFFWLFSMGSIIDRLYFKKKDSIKKIVLI